ncbi:hypothetical protein RIF29_04074 [Crotalaria pallida]|uniref:HD-Zip IV C-terminal domain-containing protein n=1 Tax=Crotalaria pallida TaxID=3830 RepID=A0AAN9J347_CROPI
MMSLIALSQRMANSFQEALNLTTCRPDYTVSCDEIDLFLTKMIAPTQPNGVIICAAGFILLPVPPANVFNFLSDENRRHEWDVLTAGLPVRQISHIPIGTDAANRITILEPMTSNSQIFQQASRNPQQGSYLIVYTPITEQEVQNIANGQLDHSQLPITPSGFYISSGSEAFNNMNAAPGTVTGTTRGHHHSHLTVAFQILTPGGSTNEELGMESLASIHDVFKETVQNIKTALNC